MISDYWIRTIEDTILGGRDHKIENLKGMRSTCHFFRQEYFVC